MAKKNVLVTGGSRGIGRAIVNCFRKNGYKVIAPSRDELDLLSDYSINAYLERMKEPVDILVNNAGINQIATLDEVTDENISETFQVNLLAPLKLSKNLALRMIKQRAGKIINIGSVWGSITKPGRVTYTITKSGLEGLTRSLAIELAPYNILVNCVAPGYVNTEMTRKNNSLPQLGKIRSAIPLKRLCEPVEIAEVVLFLASEKNSYITGQTIIVDGGYACI